MESPNPCDVPDSFNNSEPWTPEWEAGEEYLEGCDCGEDDCPMCGDLQSNKEQL